MECPFRTITKTENNVITTDYADCYNMECPWYCSETICRQFHFNYDVVLSDNKQLKDVLKELTDDVTCKDCEHFLGMGDWNLCCTETSDLCYEDTPVCEKFKLKKIGE